MNSLLLISIFILFQSNLIFSQLGSQDTGGPLSPEQAAYDVKYYNINLKINPELQTIDGWVGVTVNVIDNIKELILDLDDRYRITKIVWKSFEDYKELTFKHEEGKIKIDVPIEINIGDLLSVEIHYNGKPRVAERPPCAVSPGRRAPPPDPRRCSASASAAGATRPAASDASRCRPGASFRRRSASPARLPG